MEQDGIMDTAEDGPGDDSYNLMSYDNGEAAQEISTCQKAKMIDVLFNCRNNLCHIPDQPDVRLNNSNGLSVNYLEYTTGEPLDILYAFLDPQTGTNTGNFAKWRIFDCSNNLLFQDFAPAIDLNTLVNQGTLPDAGNYVIEVRDQNLFSPGAGCVSSPTIVNIHIISCNNDGICDPGEDCQSCPDDCGPCSSPSSAPILNCLNINQIQIQYNAPIDAASLNTSSLRIWGEETGLRTGAYAASGNLVTFTANEPFRPGELLHIVARNTIQFSSGGSAPAHSWIRQAPATNPTAPYFGNIVNTGIVLPAAAYANSYQFLALDLNRDGRQDLLHRYHAAYGASTNILVYLRNPDGTFSAPATYSNSASHSAMSSAPDLNNDGYPDLLVMHNVPSQIQVRLNDGTGTLGSPAFYPVTNYCNGVLYADVDLDGDLDLLAFAGNASLSANTISLLINNGDGTFQPQQTISTGVFGSSLMPADADNDGDIDLLYTSNTAFNSAPYFRIFLNDGTGGFSLNTNEANPATRYIVGAFDYNGDGVTDMLSASSGQGLEVHQANNTLPWTLNNPTPLDAYQGRTFTGDLDSDGDLDVISPNRYDGTSWNTLPMQYFLNDGNGNFSSADPNQFIPGTYSYLSDYDGDGDLDIYYIENGAIYVALNGPSPLPACSNLASPANGAVGVPADASLAWTSAGGATGYRISVGTTPGGSDILNNVDVGAQTSADPGILPYGATIYVRITPYNSTGDASGCPEESFTTVEACISDGLFAYYPLDGNADDLSGNNHQGTINGATPATGRSGAANSAYAFDGANDEIRVPNPFGNAITDALPISTSLWVKTSTVKPNAVLLSYFTRCFNNGSDDDYFMVFFANDELQYSNGSGPPVGLSAPSLFDGEYHHIGSSFDGTSVRLYVDGAMAGDYNLTILPNAIPATYDLVIGNSHINNCGDNAFFQGFIDDVKLYDRVLSDQDFLDLYTDCSGATLGCTDPTAHNYNPAATQDDGSCQTCSDGIQNGDETDVDCGGNLCGPCSCTTVVTNTNDSGPGSLREAINCANSNPGADLISFNIGGTPPFIISPATKLPAIIDDYTTIDGTTQPGYSLGDIIIDGINVDGGFSDDDGLELNANYLEVYGLHLRNFTPGDAIEIWGFRHDMIIGSDAKPNIITESRTAIFSCCQGTQNITIQGNYIGTDPSGADLGNSWWGVSLQGVNRALVERNTIAYSFRDGIALTGPGSFNRFTQNTMYCNTSSGISISAYNQGKTAPVVSTATGLEVGGTSSPGDLVEVFAHDDAPCPGARCQGKTYLGNATADPGGNWTLSGAFTPGTRVVATATDAAGNTSEFSGCLEVTACPDADADNLCDADDPCPFDPDNDLDGDGLCGNVDNCPADANPDQYDVDADGIGDACDPLVYFDEVATGLSDYVEGLNLDPRVESSLTRRLDLSIGALCGSGNSSTAISYLNNLISYVQYQSGNGIPADEADYIIAQLQALIAAINAGTVQCGGGNQRAFPGGPGGEPAAGVRMEIFPNPATRELNIRVEGLQGNAQLTIYDKLGRQAWTAPVEPGQTALQVALEENRYANGLYLVRLATPGEAITRRLIVNR